MYFLTFLWTFRHALWEWRWTCSQRERDREREREREGMKGRREENRVCLKGKVWRESGTVLFTKEIDKRDISMRLK